MLYKFTYVCVCVCLCAFRHTFCQLDYRSDPSTDLNGIFTVNSLKDADLRKDVPFAGLDDE